MEELELICVLLPTQLATFSRKLFKCRYLNLTHNASIIILCTYGRARVGTDRGFDSINLTSKIGPRGGAFDLGIEMQLCYTGQIPYSIIPMVKVGI